MSDLERPIHQCEQQVASWRREQHTEVVLVITVIAIGVVISALQGSNNKWAKSTTIVLGVGTAILAGINARVFTADDRSLRRAAFDGDAVIAQLWVTVDTLKNDLNQQDKLTARGRYLKELEDFHAIGERLNGTAAIAADNTETHAWGLGVLRVHAQSRNTVPEWAKKPPFDNTSLYFVGKANDTSLTNAKTSSLDDAFHNAVLALRSLAPNASESALLDLVKASAVLQDSTFVYDKNTGSYSYFTLIRLSREIQGIGVKSLPP